MSQTKKTMTKQKLFINTPSQKYIVSEPSPINNSKNVEIKSGRNQNPRATTTKNENLNSGMMNSQRLSNSKSPHSATSKLHFLKTKLTIGHPRDSLLDENIQIPGKNRQDVGSISRLEKTEHTISSSSLNTSNNALTPRNKTNDTIKDDEIIPPLRKPSPLHHKSNSMSRPLMTLTKNYGLSKKTGLGHTKNHSVSSIECLSQSNFFSQNPSLANSRIFAFNQRDFLDDSYDQLNNLKSVNLADNERCANHPHKKAKYYVLSDRDETEADNKYCSKCAIKLVAQGFKVQEILSSDEAMRKSELEEFLIKLVGCKRNIHSFITALKKKKEDLSNFFNRQEEKTESLYSSLETLIQEEKKKSLDKLKTNREEVLNNLTDVETNITSSFAEMATMQGDIEKNIESIVRNISLDPFKSIINQYEGKVNNAEQEMENFKLQQIIVNKLPNLNQKVLDKLRTHIAVLYSPIRLTTSIVKKNENSDEMSGKNSTEEEAYKSEKSSIYISFENKEIFENAMSSGDESTRRCSEALYHPYGGDLIGKLANNYNGIAPTLRIEDLRNPETPLHDIMNKKVARSPGDSKTASCLSKTPQARITKNLTVRFNTEESERYGLKQHEISNSPPTKTFNLDSYGDKENIPPKNHDQTGLTSSGLSSTGKNAKKYITILDKINENQTKKGLYYTKIMKTNPLISPRYNQTTMDEEMEDILHYNPASKIEERSQEESVAGTVSGFTVRSSKKSNKSSPNYKLETSGSEQRFENPQKELRNFESMVSFIENKIVDEKRSPMQLSFQKTLFCSPNFKENVNPNTTTQV